MLSGLVERSHDDFAFLKGQLIENLTNRAKLDEFRTKVNAFREKNQADPEIRKQHSDEMVAMGKWLGEYFDDAGYEGWKFYPEYAIRSDSQTLHTSTLLDSLSLILCVFEPSLVWIGSSKRW